MDFISGGVNNSAIKHYEKEILSDKINNLFLSASFLQIGFIYNNLPEDTTLKAQSAPYQMLPVQKVTYNITFLFQI